MKKIALVTVFALVISASFAQTEQGRMMVGGSLGLQGTTYKTKNNSTTTKTSTTTAFSLNPQFGYFVINNLAVGIGLDFTAGVSKDSDSDYKYKSTSLLAEPFVRYYLPMKIFFQGAAGIGSSKDKETYGNTANTYKYSASRVSLAAGYAWFLNKNVAIEPMVGFSSYREKRDGNSAKNIQQSPFIKVGFQIYLGK